MDAALCKQFIFRHMRPGIHPRPACKKRADLRSRVLFNFRNAALRDHMSTLCTGFRPHLDQPVSFL